MDRLNAITRLAVRQTKIGCKMQAGAIVYMMCKKNFQRWQTIQ